MNSGYYSMTKEQATEEIKKMRAVVKKITKSKETARAFLIKGGFADKDGNLAAQYR